MANIWGFLGESITLKPQTFTLDVDGNGKVSALGDGFMIIRKTEVMKDWIGQILKERGIHLTLFLLKNLLKDLQIIESTDL